jgi:4-amino-4-deoxy-L-arabinose transferase-like glycosyltransferase
MNKNPELMRRTAGSVYVNIVTVLSFSAALYVLVLNVFTTSRVLCGDLEFNFYCGDIFMVNILLIAIGLSCCIFLPRTGAYLNIREFLGKDRHLFWAKVIILSLIAIFGTLLILTSDYEQVYDSRSILEAAEGIRTGDHSSFSHLGYLDIYPHLNGLVIFYYMISLVAGDHLETCILFINLLTLLLLYRELSAIGKRLGLGPIGQLLVLLAGLIFLPAFLYVLIVYGNIESIAFLALTVRLLIDLMRTDEKRKCILYGILSVFCAGLACIFKQNVFVMLVAVCIWLIFRSISSGRYLRMLPVAGIIVAMALSSIIPGRILYGLSGYKTQGTNYMSYLAMGASEDTQNFAGGYNGYNAFSFAEADGDKKAQGEIAKKLYKEKIDGFISDPSYMINFMTRKQVHQWSDPIYRANRSIQVMKEGPDNSLFSHMLQDRFSTYVQSICFEPFQLMIWSGIVIFLWINCKRRDGKLLDSLVFPLMFLGGFIFHTFWEAKSPYAYPYFIMLFPVAITGLADLGKKTGKLRSELRKVDLKKSTFSWSFRFTMASVAVILLLAAVAGLSSMRVQLKDDEAQYKKYALTGVYSQADDDQADSSSGSS